MYFGSSPFVHRKQTGGGSIYSLLFVYDFVCRKGGARMNEKKYRRYLKDVKLFSILLFLAFVGSTIYLSLKLDSFKITSTLIVSLVLNSLCLFGIVLGCHKEKLYGPICGILYSIVLFLSDGLFPLFGILLCIESIQLFRYMKKQEKN